MEIDAKLGHTLSRHEFPHVIIILVSRYYLLDAGICPIYIPTSWYMYLRTEHTQAVIPTVMSMLTYL